MPGSIDEIEYRRLGGLDQWTMVRGERVSNPPLILLHGGPGLSETDLFRYYLAKSLADGGDELVEIGDELLNRHVRRRPRSIRPETRRCCDHRSARKALRMTATSMPSWSNAPATGGM